MPEFGNSPADQSALCIENGHRLPEMQRLWRVLARVPDGYRREGPCRIWPACGNWRVHSLSEVRTRRPDTARALTSIPIGHTREHAPQPLHLRESVAIFNAESRLVSRRITEFGHRYLQKAR